jgi:hypothetical protein
MLLDLADGTRLAFSVAVQREVQFSSSRPFPGVLDRLPRFVFCTSAFMSLMMPIWCRSCWLRGPADT